LGVELENTPENTFLVRRFLKALKQRFDGNYGSAHIDEGMFNAGRITKAAGVSLMTVATLWLPWTVAVGFRGNEHIDSDDLVISGECSACHGVVVVVVKGSSIETPGRVT
jgi:hypothetical protein